MTYEDNKVFEVLNLFERDYSFGRPVQFIFRVNDGWI